MWWRLFEVDVEFRPLDLIKGESCCHFLEAGALFSRCFDLDGLREGEAFGADSGESSPHLFSVEGECFHLIANVDFILAGHLEGLPQSGRPDFEFEICFVAIQTVFYEFGEFYAVVDPYAFGMVNLYGDAIVARYGEVGQEVVFSLEPLVDELSYNVFTDHSVLCYNRFPAVGLCFLPVEEILEPMGAGVYKEERSFV